ncbi:protoheme IX farnesyltransferase [Halobiforma lacisalsi AJ5]|uniref:Protoheme IX farnesyltransferase n=1 Tax=Natronobacterium lacisalsi AJ5 TaxID=358396 RepID=M0LKI1_NATLA|nr:heme o synthase [Halobiforma lacisalsi]APW98633.1 protoheme IX farnesyltransferase [Halobiforma lacisalsi AJ5]EMA32500.1 protoheme IX farnesyltransferase [Halobiforma lacisalsi AJ5]
MMPPIDRRRFGDLLGATAIAAYLLIALGTAVSTTGSGSSCTTWPSCSSDWTIGPMTGDALLFWGHRAAALAAGLLVVATALAAWRLDVDRRAKAGIAVAVVLFPVQVALGAALVLGASTLVGVAHLVFAMAIFGGLLGALAVTLENRALEREQGETDLTEPIASDPTLTSAPAGDPADGPEAEPSTEVRIEDLGTIERLRRTAGAYLTLTKPKLMWLLCLVALAGVGLATVTGESVAVSTVAATLLGGVLAIGASGTFNHVLERDRDRKMDRTNDRPLVHDLVPVRNAVAFAICLVAASIAVMLTWVNALAAGLTLAAIAYYSVLYTAVLKPNTAWNTVLGGGAGALPALIGWAAVTGSVGLPAVVLAAVIFWWTPAHFYSLAIAYREDYARGGFPMFPVVEGVLTARRHVLLFLGATLLSASLLGWLAGLGWLYTVTSVALGAVFLRSVVRQYRESTDDAALRSFYVSNYYLGAILVAIVLETIVVA